MAGLEIYLKAMITGETDNLPEPTGSLCTYLKGVLTGDTDVPTPTSTLGVCIKTVVDNGGGDKVDNANGVKF